MNEGRTLPSSFDVMVHVRQNVYDHPPWMDYISIVFKEWFEFLENNRVIVMENDDSTITTQVLFTKPNIT
jgi:hypothetical protein